MSVKASNYVWEHSEMTGPRRLIMLKIADSANEDGWCWLGVGKIADRCKQDAAHTRRYISQIEQAGELIVFERRVDGSNINLTNLYKIVMPGTSDIPPVDLKGELVRRDPNRKSAGTGETAGTPPQIREGGAGNSAGTPPANSPANPLDDPLFNQTDLDDESRVREDEDLPVRPNIFTVYEQNIGLITGLIKDELVDAERDFPAEWITAAFKVAVDNNARRWSYVRSVLDGWQRNGFGWKPGSKRDAAAPRPAANTSRPPIAFADDAAPAPMVSPFTRKPVSEVEST